MKFIANVNNFIAKNLSVKLGSKHELYIFMKILAMIIKVC